MFNKIYRLLFIQLFLAVIALSSLSLRGAEGDEDDDGIATSQPGKVQPFTPGKAKSVIEIWMWGGPSQIDTFDPKPDAPRDYNNGQKAIPTNVEGVYLNESLPKLAEVADKFAIIRSMTHGIFAHETATYMMQTGRNPGGGVVYPAIGAVIARLKSEDGSYKGKLPPYVVLTKAKGRFSETGFLGPKYKPLVTGGDPNKSVFQVDGIVAQGITKKHQLERRKLLAGLDTLGKALPGDPDFKRFDKAEDEAYELITGKAGEVFDLSQESKETRDRYGRNTFGQSCLMARRLVEQGVPYITINAQGWDTHKRHFESTKKSTADMDQAIAALIKDLDERKLLDTTIVWWTGEFGRTPKILWNEPWNGGRGHYGTCFSAMVAGGGFKGGCVVGASDGRAEHVASRPVYPQDMLGSIYELMGIDPNGLLPNPMGLDLKIMPPSIGEDGRLKEIYKDVK